MGLLRGESGEGQGLFGIAMVSSGINPVRDVVADHAVLHALLEIFVEMGEDDLADRLDGMATVFGQGGQIRSDSGCGALHGEGGMRCVDFV